MKRFGCLLLLALALCGRAYGVVYRLESWRLPEGKTIGPVEIDIDSDNPACIRLLPGTKRLELRGMKSAEVLDAGRWCETYATWNRKATVRIEKSLTEGVRSIELIRPGTSLKFVPGADGAVSVVSVPPLLIEQAQFASVDRKGRIVEDFGSGRLDGGRMKFLAPKISYRTWLADIPVTLDVKILDRKGRLIRDSKSPKDCSRRISFRTGTDLAAGMEQSLDRLRGPFGRGCRMEIYCDSMRLYSTAIAVKGRTLYYPILSYVRSDYQGPPRWMRKKWSKYQILTPEQQQVVWRELHLRNYTGPISEDCYITGWRTVEE